MHILNQHLDQIIRLRVLNTVNDLFAFGSVTTENYTPKSDIDLVVELMIPTQFLILTNTLIKISTGRNS